MRFIIDGRPVTKKNHTQRIRRGTRTFTVQSDAHRAWEQYAILQVKTQLHRYRGTTLSGEPLNLRALFYRPIDTGDLGNYLAAVCDVLQAAGAVSDDSYIMGFDGSRLLLDKARPRIEVELSPLAA